MRYIEALARVPLFLFASQMQTAKSHKSFGQSHSVTTRYSCTIPNFFLQMFAHSKKIYYLCSAEI
jgi:hypothetical protein